MYNPAVRGFQYIFYVSLIDQGNPNVFKANPTLAAGDVKVSIDGAAEANITTLPTVTPAAGKHVKVTLSAAEMTGDNISVIFSDGAGAEWCDLQIPIQPNAAIAGGICTTGGSSTSVVCSSFSSPPGASNQRNGRVLIFDLNTTSQSLRGAASTINGETNANPPTFSLLDALPVTPSTGDSFKIY